MGCVIVVFYMLMARDITCQAHAVVEKNQLFIVKTGDIMYENQKEVLRVEKVPIKSLSFWLLNSGYILWKNGFQILPLLW